MSSENQTEVEIMAAAFEQLRKLPPHAVMPALGWIKHRLRVEMRLPRPNRAPPPAAGPKVEPMKLDGDI